MVVIQTPITLIHVFSGDKFLPLGKKKKEGLVTHKKDFWGEKIDPSCHTF